MRQVAPVFPSKYLPSARISFAPTRRLALAGLAVAGLWGCATSEFAPRSDAPAYPAYKGEVELLESFPAPGTYEQLGVITVEVAGFSYATTGTGKLRKAAAARGANAVVLQGKERQVRDAAGHERSILAGWAIRRR